MMRSHGICVAAALVAAFLISACEQGIAPVANPVPGRSYGIRGTIYFLHWPPPDSILDLRVAALQHYPVASIPDEVLNGRARYSDQLPYGRDSIAYQLTLPPLPPGTIPFIGVAQRYGPNVQQDWRVVGVYYAGGDTTQPGQVVVPADSMVPGVNIIVDFNHLPPQP